MRKSCLDCTRKHLAEASILMTETMLGYPQHRWLAMGHLAQAEAESVADYLHIAISIREHRKAYELDPNYRVPIMKLIEEVSNEVRSLQAGD